MILPFKKLIRYLLSRRDLQIVKVQNISQAINDIEKKSLRQKERELSSLALHHKKMNNHKEYNTLLRHFIKTWNIQIDSAQFVGKGYSLSGFNTYRKVIVNNRTFFEKVYFNSFIDLSKVLWFQKKLYPIINEEINVPSIRSVYRGRIITIVYFEFLNLHPLIKEEKENSIIHFTKYIYSLSIDNKQYIEKLKPPFYIRNYRIHFQYSSYAHLAEQMLKRSHISLEKVENLINTFPKILAHGDIYSGNAFKNKTLIDWDSYGLYPIGFDVAFIYCRYNLKRGETNSLEWLNNNFYHFIQQEHWNKFKLSFSYFLLIFAIEYFQNQQLLSEKDLISNFKKAYFNFK